MNGIQQGRLWAVRNSPNSPIFHTVETGLPYLFKTRKGADIFKRHLKQGLDCDAEVVGVEIVAKSQQK